MNYITIPSYSAVDGLRIRLKYRGNSEKAKDLFDEVLAYLKVKFKDVDIWRDSTKNASFRKRANIPAGESSITIGYGFNLGGKCDWKLGFLDFNPAKTYPSPELRYLYKLLGNIGELEREIVRWDFATDYPVSRECLALVKDGRNYQSVISRSFTEYLGTKHKNGYVKLYDKRQELIEQGKEQIEPLTRLEITLEEKPGRKFWTGENGKEIPLDEWPRVLYVPDEVPDLNCGMLRLLMLSWTHGVELEVALQGVSKNSRTRYRNAIEDMCGRIYPSTDFDECRKDALAWADTYGGLNRKDGS